VLHSPPTSPQSPGRPDPLVGLAERFAPPPVDVFAELGYVPTAKQQQFHDAVEWDVLYGGAAGGGKTKAILLDAIRDCVRYPGITIAAFRRTYPELEESLIAELEAIDFAQAVGAGPARYNTTKHDLRFANGSLIRFRYAETVKDATRRQGSEIQKLIVDERTQVPPGVVEYLATRLRSGKPNVPVLGIRSGTNPGGIGHADVKANFVDATDNGAHIVTDDRGRSRRFIPAKVGDNPHVNVEYERDLDAIADPHLRAALKDGSWDTFAGQFFAEWSRDRHVVRPFEIPKTWRRIAGVDWGFAAPWAVEWAAIDGDRRVWVYRELYDTEVGEHDQAKRILTAEGALTADGKVARLPGDRIDVRVADPSMWGRRGDATPIAQVYAGEGCHLLPADNDRVNGWQRVHSYLAEGPACRLHRALGWETCPWLHVFETCVNVIRTLPALPHDDKKPEDVDTDAEDHAPDALRYLLMRLSVPQAAKERKPEPETIQERIDTHLAERIRNKRRRSGAVIGS
jgi:hypothetical protein